MLSLISNIGGTGKTFVYLCLTYLLRGRSKKCASVAWTGIAATLLPEGRTCHHTFGIPPTSLNRESRSTLNPKSEKAKDLIQTDIILWDEVPMSPGDALSLVDLLLQDLMKNNLPFGGKTIIMGGDFRQVTPVIPHASKAQIIESSVKSSDLWQKFRVLKLKKNQRVEEGAQDYADWLLKLGEKRLPILSGTEDTIELPDKVVCRGDIIEEVIIICENNNSNF